MKRLWEFRACLILFIPAVLLGTTSFFQGILSCFAIILGGFVMTLCILCRHFFATGRRIRFYLFLFLFCSGICLPYPIIYSGVDALISPSFWNYIMITFPLVPLFFVLEKTVLREPIDYIHYFGAFLIFFCISFPLLGFIREVLDFREFHFWGGPNGVISLVPLFRSLGISDLQNTFFSNPVGGMLLVGLLGSLFYGILRKKYES